VQIELELVPQGNLAARIQAASDALVINGSLAIAPGATLKIVGERPLTPGVSYKLIAASDGIRCDRNLV
jgi:acyl CoA:acetate/3-ketoacid CoA transferase alpha subunit